jgi:hypothetical protein
MQVEVGEACASLEKCIQFFWLTIFMLFSS